MKKLFSLLLFTLLAVTAFAADAVSAAYDYPPAASPWKPLLDLLGGNSGRMLQIVALIGALRIPVKLFSSQLQSFFERALARIVETSDTGDDHIAKAILSNPLYRLIAFVVDMVTSLKLPLDLPVNTTTGKVSSAGKFVTSWLAIGALSATLTGCGTLAPDGAYKGDKTLYTADQTITGAYDALHTFVKWEYQNRSALAEHPEITEAADGIRANAQAWISSAIAMRDAYALNPTDDQRSHLDESLVVLRAALKEAAQYMARPPTKRATATTK